MDFDSHNEHSFFNDGAKKILLTLVGVLIVYLIVFVGALIRNELVEYYYIGQAERQQNFITVEGSAEVDVIPDKATVRLGVQVRAATQQAAQQEGNETMNELIARLQTIGIEKKDIATDEYSVYPWYNYTDGSRVQDGYQASQNVTVTIRDTANAERVLQVAGDVGANTIGGLNFEVDDTDEYEEAAREEAIDDAIMKAKKLAAQLGVRLVRIVSYNEYGGGGYPQPYYSRSYDFGVMSDSEAPTIEPGTDEVTMNVSVTFEIR